jgi:folate-binding protein YgfZ
MTTARIALLPDRGFVRVAGEDAGKLLQGLVTNDIDLLAGQPAIHAALLTPQGKILFEFFVVKVADDYILETRGDQVEALINRLRLYKLRARVDIRDATADYRAAAAWGDAAQSARELAASAVVFADPRLDRLGLRMLVGATTAPDTLSRDNAGADAGDYDAHRVASGVPELGKDYASGEVFAHEANLDLLNAVSFTKGCFVGQEVVSRIQHRGTARTRTVIVETSQPLPPGSKVMAGPAAIGTIGSTAGNRALALVRLDRVEEARRKDEPLTVAGNGIAIRLPDYLRSAVAS